VLDKVETTRYLEIPAVEYVNEPEVESDHVISSSLLIQS
jgi:hypothetical protein